MLPLLAALVGTPALSQAPKNRASAAASGVGAPAASGETVAVQIRPGDTLLGIAQERLEPAHGWRAIARLNRIADPLRLSPGATIQLPVAWLKGTPAQATVETVNGPASGGDGSPLAAGQRLDETAVVQTGEGATVVLRLPDGSTLRISPASRLRIERLRSYHRPEVVEARIALERGRVDTTAASPRQRPLQIRSPYATAAVRGTVFRVGAGDEASTSEVLEGGVGWSATRGQVAIGAGFGSRADPRGEVSVPEPLLPAPALAGLPERVERTVSTLSFAPVEGAAAYVVTVARDAEFRDLIATTRSAAPHITIVSSDDGIHHVRVRAVAASSIEGFDASARVDVQARPEPPLPASPPDGAVVFGEQASLSWAASPRAAGYRVQFADDPQFGRIRRDLRVAETRATLPIEPGPGAAAQDRYWRVATVAADGARIGPFGQPSRLQWRSTPAAPQAGPADDGVVQLRWDGTPGERYRVEVAIDPSFAVVLHALDTDRPSITLPALAPGQWHVRLRRTTADGVVTPWSPSQRLDIPALLRSGHGNAVVSGSGTPIETPRP